MLNIKNISEEISSSTKKELPLYFPSPIYYSLYAAIRFSILLSAPNTYPWFYSNFIQLRFDEEKFQDQLQYDDEKVRKSGLSDHILHIFPIDEMKKNHKGASFYLDEITLDNSMFDFNEKTLISEIVNYINNGFYITTHIDVSKMPGTRYYNEIPTVHSVLIYAYDLEDQCFKHIDFNENGSISILRLSFKDFLDSFFSDSVPESQRIKKMKSIYYVTLWKINKDYNFIFNINNVKQLLSDYLNSENTSIKYSLFIPEKKGIYGIKVYDSIIRYIQITSSMNELIDYRVFHVLYEHKKIMTYRLEYLESIGNLDRDLRLSQKFSIIEKKANNLRNLAMKYIYTKERYILDLIITELNEICFQEKPIIEECIKNCH